MRENKYLKWLSANTASVYWHDSAVEAELKTAMSNGAVGVTTNPFLVNAALNACPEYWRDYIEKIPKGLSGAEKAEALIACVTGHISKLTADLQDGKMGHGYCCAQVNPNHPGKTEEMIEQARRYAKIAGNIVIKLPATRSGIEAMEECAALGYNVAATVSFTVPQVLAAGAAFERGIKRAKAAGLKPGLGIAVLMVGRLDDYLRDVAQDSKSCATENDIVQSGTAAIKRAYGIFNENRYSCVLMPAGCRSGHHAADLAGGRMIMSVAPKIAEELEDGNWPLVEKIDEPVDSRVIDRLMTIQEFRRAYEPGGLTPDQFITYGATNRTLTQFCVAGWDALAARK